MVDAAWVSPQIILDPEENKEQLLTLLNLHGDGMAPEVVEQLNFLASFS